MNRILTSALTLALAALLAGLFATPAAAAGKKPHVDPALTRQVAKGAREPIRVIIQAGRAKRAELEARFTNREATASKSHALLGGLSATVDAAELAALLQDRDVSGVSLDQPIGTHFAPDRFKARSVADTRLDSGLGSVLPPDGPWSGRGVGVAVIDSGIANHPDFGRRITAFWDFTGKRPVRRAPMDPYGHGTYVAGLIGGTGNRTRGEVSGVAPDVRLIGLRVLDGTGQGQTSDVIEAIEFAIAHKVDLGIDILNLSIGHPVTESAWTDPLVATVERAVRAGLIVVVSAGNFGRNPETGEVGYAGISSPGNSPSAITVGAATTMGTATILDDVVADFSSRGPTWIDMFAKPDVVAPGHRLVATATDDSYIYRHYPSLRFRSVTGRKMLMMSGTSSAAGVVSGVVARMVEANRTLVPWGGGLTANAVKLMLQYSAVLLADPARTDAVERFYHPLVEGAGRVNASGAIGLASAYDAAAPMAAFAQPATTFVPTGDDGTSEVWEWGQRIIWGDSVLFGQRIIWGDADLSAQRIIWGDSVLTPEGLLSVLCTGLRWGTQLDTSQSGNLVDNDFVANPGDSPISDGIIWADNLVWGKVTFGSNIQFGDSVAWRDNLLLSESIVWGNIRGR